MRNPEKTLKNRRTSLIPLCRHTKADGLLCGCPALTGRSFCYHHQRYHHLRRPGGRPPLPRNLDTPEAIRRQLSSVFTGLLSGHLRPSQASRMLYILQLAVANLKWMAMK